MFLLPFLLRFLLPFLTTFSWNSLKITWPASENVDIIHFEALNEKVVIRLAGPDPITTFLLCFYYLSYYVFYCVFTMFSLPFNVPSLPPVLLRASVRGFRIDLCF